MFFFLFFALSISFALVVLLWNPFSVGMNEWINEKKKNTRGYETVGNGDQQQRETIVFALLFSNSQWWSLAKGKLKRK